MGIKKRRTNVGLDIEDCDYIEGLRLFNSRADGIRFAVKLMRLYSIPAIKAIRKDALVT